MKGFETARRREGYVDGYKTENEDHVGVFEAWDALVLVVADGVGGRANGGAAAQRAVEVVQKAIGGERPNDEAAVWAERLAGMDRILSRARNMGETTAVVAAVTPGRTCRIVGAGAGDSEAWLIGPEQTEVLTRHQEQRPFVGSGAARPVPFEIEWSGVWENATLLLASDGLFKYAEPARIQEAARKDDLEQAAHDLLALPRLPSGKLQDDVGLLLCRRERKPSSGGEAAGSVLKTVGRLLNWGRRDK